MASPMVSVLMPVYNAGGFLAEAVESVLGQSFEDLELLVMDDGSEDDSLGVLDTFNDPRLRVFSQPNAGQAVARNALLRQARGQFVALMDADDVSRPQRLADQVAFMHSNPDVALVGASYQLIDEHGRPGQLVPVLLADAEIRRDLYTRCPFGNSTVMLRRVALEQAGGWNRDWPPSEDYELWTRVMPLARVANLPAVLTNYRVHSQQSSSELQAVRAEQIVRRLWEAGSPPRLTVRQFLDDRRRYRAVDQALSRVLWNEYIDRTWALLVEAARRNRWAVLLEFSPVVPLLVAERLRRKMARAGHS